jgi:filamentous hemagglutinin family protein
VFVGVATQAANILPTQGATNLAAPTGAGSLTAKTLVGGVVTTGTIGYTSTGAAATVALSAPRTLIDWTTFEVGAGNTLTFNFVNNSDIVLNRVAGGTISVDAGGAVNGTVGPSGATGGNLWFIAPNGVFLHGTVTASGVLASNNASVPDLNLLSDNVSTLKGELAAASSLFDFEGSVTATDASIDASGNLILNGDVNTGPAGTVDLVSTNAVTQTAGVITATSLTGSSAGATALTDGNLFDTLGAFTGSGGVNIVDAQPAGLTVTGAVTVAAGNTLSLTTTAGPLTIAASQTLSGGALNLASASLLTINAPVTVEGATAVSLSYFSDTSTSSLRFGNSGALTFANADGTPATASQGGSLTINGQPYTLLYKLALPGSTGPDTGLDDIAGIDLNDAANGDFGFYALAVNLTGTGTPAAPQFTGTLAGAGLNTFNGVFHGLGHTITNLTINDASNDNVGLFGANAGFIGDVGLVGGSLTANAPASAPGVSVLAGGLVGLNTGTINVASASASVTDNGGGARGGVVGVGGLAGGNSGQIALSSAAGPVASAPAPLASVYVGGLVGQNNANASITLSSATGAVTGPANSSVGGLVGFNNGTISQANYDGVVSIPNAAFVGGLVGDNDTTGVITVSSAVGTVTGGGANSVVGGLAGYNAGLVSNGMAQVAVEDSQSGAQLGGLVGENDVAGRLTLTLATGPVNGGPGGDVGGLVGHNLGAMDNGLATGAVSGGLNTGGLVGHNDVAGTISGSAFDILTTGQTNGIGLDANPVGQSGGIAAATTSQLQTAGLPLGFNVDQWSGGRGGLYPYLNAFFRTGAQAVSGFAYSDAGLTPLASGVNGPVGIGLVGGGVFIGGSFTGANGYYYVVEPGGSIGAGETLLAYTAPGVPGAATLSTATGVASQSGLDLYGGAVTVPTTAATFSAAPTLAQAQSLALAAAGAVADAQTAIQAATGRGLVALGPNFTVDQSVTTPSTLVIETSSGAPLTVGAPITLTTGGSLGLLSGGALAINAPVMADGAIGVNLAYDASQPTNLSFAAGAALTFATSSGGVATSSQGGVLAINGQAYTLLYNLAQFGSSGPDAGLDDIAGIDANLAAGGDAGLYALATDVAGTGSIFAPQFTSALAGAGSNTFTGVFEGLGHTVTNLTISDRANPIVGLFGASAEATVRDIGVVGGFVSGQAASAVGSLVGDNEGLIVNAYSSAVVSNGGASGYAGGLAGQSGGAIINAYATGAVTGAANGEAGGLVGDGAGSINQAFATGAVTVGMNGGAGGLLGAGDASINQAYATGAVSGGPGATLGGLVGAVGPMGTVSAGAFDSVTTGQSSAFGSNADPSGTSAVALTTAQFQSGSLPVGFDAAVWGVGPGLYPSLISAFPGGVQAVSGVAYSDEGATPLPSGAGGAVTVELTAGGVPVGTATTGANGYYYVFAPLGTIAAGESLVAAIIAGAPVASNSYAALGSMTQTGVNIYGAPQGLPIQGAVNLATPTASGSLASNTLIGGVETPGTTGYISTGTTATITLSASRTLIDWTSFIVGAGRTLNFDFTGSANDIVLNRVVGGAISVDIGGSVNGFFNGAAGGNVWFLASNGVFLHGVVAAGGVLASNNTSLPDLNLLSDSVPTLKGELATGASLIDLTGVVTVTGASIDGSGNLVLGGDVDTGPAGAVELVSTGTITQTGGIITASTLGGASNGAATLTDQNQVATLGGFTTTAGALAFTDAIASGLTIGGDVSAGGGDIAITSTAPGATLTLAANLTTDPTHAVTLISAGPIVQSAGAIKTSTVSGSSVGGAALTGANLFSNLGPFANLDASEVTIVDSLPSGLTVTGAVDAGAGNALSLITTAGPLTLAADVSAAGGMITLASAGAISQTAGIITTGALTGSSSGGARLTDANQFATLTGFTNADSGAISLTDAQSLTISGALDNTTVLLRAGVGRDIAIDVTAGDLTATAPITAAGDVALQAVSGSLTLSTLSSGDDVVLAAVQGAVNLNGSVTAAGTAAPGAGLTLFNAISGPTDGLFTLGDQSLFVEAKTFSNAAGSPLTAGNAIGLLLSDPGGLSLADANPGGSWVRPATLLAPSVTLFESAGNLNVATATIGGPINTLNLFSANIVQVTGAFAPATDNTVNLTIGSPTNAAWAPLRIEVVNDGGDSANQGSIGYETIANGGTYSATPLTFHSANLYATSDILMGTSAFIAANAAVTGAALQLTNPNTPIPATPANTSLTVLLAAHDASLAAGSQIVQQDTAGLDTHNGVGTYVTGALTLAAYGGSPPLAIDLFGALVSASGVVVTGPAAAASSQIVLSGSLPSSPYRFLYRFNGCAIGFGGCLTGPPTTISVVTHAPNPGGLLGVADIGPPGDPQNADDQSDGSEDSGAGPGGRGPANLANGANAGEAAFQDNPFSALGQRAIHPQINMSYVIRNGFLRFEDTDIEDLTITGAPNEEVWRKPEVRP